MEALVRTLKRLRRTIKVTGFFIGLLLSLILCSFGLLLYAVWTNTAIDDGAIVNIS